MPAASAAADGHEVLVGTRRLLDERSIPLGPAAHEVERLLAEGKTLMLVAVDAALTGVVAAAFMQLATRVASGVTDVPRSGVAYHWWSPPERISFLPRMHSLKMTVFDSPSRIDEKVIAPPSTASFSL